MIRVPLSSEIPGIGTTTFTGNGPPGRLAGAASSALGDLSEQLFYRPELDRLSGERTTLFSALKSHFALER